MPMIKYETRAHAVGAIGNSIGAELRKMRDRGMSVTQLREAIGRWIDLARLPDDLAEKYAHSNQAWNRFLNDIIRYARAAW